MAQALVIAVVGVVLLVASAELLVRSSVSLSRRIGAPPLLVGLTVVAFGTSAPELAVSVEAAVLGLGAVATGNVVGSNICNIGLILGLIALIRPLRTDLSLLRIDVPVAVLVSLLATAMFWDGTLSRIEGSLLVASLLLYVVVVYRRARDAEVAKPAGPGGTEVRRRPVLLVVLLVIGGIGGLAGGARLFVQGALELASGFGVSRGVIGLTLVALGTSLPEVATSTVAAWRGEADVAVGNIVGSNIFNLLGILGLAAVVSPVQRGSVEVLDFVVMIAFTAVLLPLLRTGFRVSRLEGAGLFVAYAAYVFWLLT